MATFGDEQIRGFDIAVNDTFGMGGIQCVSDFDGASYALGGPVLLASNGKVHEEMQQVTRDIAARNPSL